MTKFQTMQRTDHKSSSHESVDREVRLENGRHQDRPQYQYAGLAKGSVVEPNSIGDSTDRATQIALRNPLVLASIFEWISRDTGLSLIGCYHSDHKFFVPVDQSNNLHNCSSWRSYSCFGVLVRCATVNVIWFGEAIRWIWERSYEDPTIYGTALTILFQRTHPLRRQAYANVIRYGSDHVWYEDEQRDAVFDGITFPKMKKLSINLQHWKKIPKISCPNLEELVLIPEYGSEKHIYSVSEQHTEQYLDQIQALFPHVQSISFTDRALAYPGSMQRFAQKMTNLKTFDHSHVDETGSELNM